MARLLTQGDVVLVAFPVHQPKGREQEGQRPAIVVGVPLGRIRYPIVLIAPLTTQGGAWVNENPSLYPVLNAGVGGLLKDSIVLLDQIRALDVQRVVAYLGSLLPEDYQPLQQGLRQLFNV